MTTLAEHMIVVDAKNQLTEQEQLQDDCDVQATNIVLQGLPPDVYSLVNHYNMAKDIWDRVKLLMQGTELSYQERERKLYNEFDKFTSVKASLGEYQVSELSSPEWSKFVTDVKLAKNLYNTNYDKLYAYLSQHDGHVNEVRLLRERYPNPLALVANHHTQSHSAQTSSNPRNQATVQDGRVTIQQVQGRQGQGTWQGGALSLRGLGTLHGSRKRCCWFWHRKLGQVLDEEQLAFLADPGILNGQAIQTTILQNDAFQTDDLDAYDSDCDDISSIKAILMPNLSSYGSDVLFEVPQHDTYQNDDMLNQSVQETQYFEQSLIDYVPDNEITNDSNIISYEQYLQETQNAIVQDTNSYAQQDAMLMSVFEQMSNHVNNWDKVLSKEDFKGTRIEHGFKRAFMSLFGQDNDTFKSTMLLNTSIFAEYTGIEVKQFRETLLQHISNVKKSVAERTRHQRQYDRRWTDIKKCRLKSGMSRDVFRSDDVMSGPFIARAIWLRTIGLTKMIRDIRFRLKSINGLRGWTSGGWTFLALDCTRTFVTSGSLSTTLGEGEKGGGIGGPSFDCCKLVENWVVELDELHLEDRVQHFPDYNLLQLQKHMLGYYHDILEKRCHRWHDTGSKDVVLTSNTTLLNRFNES
ncbi:hypothetical protein Tco_1229519 [Tanacetum coccineum]